MEDAEGGVAMAMRALTITRRLVFRKKCVGYSSGVKVSPEAPSVRHDESV